MTWTLEIGPNLRLALLAGLIVWLVLSWWHYATLRGPRDRG